MNRCVEQIFLPKGTWYDFKTGKNSLVIGNMLLSIKMKIIPYLQRVVPLFH